jgi:hypothetical protein
MPASVADGAAARRSGVDRNRIRLLTEDLIDTNKSRRATSGH